MKRTTRTTEDRVSYAGLRSRSARATAAARGSSSKRDTRCELLLRKALWSAGHRYRVDIADLPGRPDIVFPRAKLAVFCDGDFWHGRNLNDRLARLRLGHNADYWTRKLLRNVERDQRQSSELKALGWNVLRLWESDILRDPQAAAARVAGALRGEPVNG